MSMKPHPIPEIPAETARVARAVFPKGNIYLQLRDTLGTIYQDELFSDLYPDRGQPAYAPWRLALVTVFQFMENLTDRQAASLQLAPESGRIAVKVSRWQARAIPHAKEISGYGS